MKELTDLEIVIAHQKRREIAIIWSIADVQSVRPDLSEDQCWDVLLHVHDHHDSEFGICWVTLEVTADELFPRNP